MKVITEIDHAHLDIYVFITLLVLRETKQAETKRDTTETKQDKAETKRSETKKSS
jgi:hypothetical protein